VASLVVREILLRRPALARLSFLPLTSLALSVALSVVLNLLSIAVWRLMLGAHAESAQVLLFSGRYCARKSMGFLQRSRTSLHDARSFNNSS
jgi:hypothetical protein